MELSGIKGIWNQKSSQEKEENGSEKNVFLLCLPGQTFFLLRIQHSPNIYVIICLLYFTTKEFPKMYMNFAYF